ncbi:MAG: WYL domain-containing protein [Planctomycetes bacterium]|nr:WYL domain-containing protein [Planctomycetota bacterium]
MTTISDTVALLSFLIAHPGITVAEAARATHRSPRTLVEELNGLLMCGVPPYSPSDYIGLTPLRAGDDSPIELHYASHFSRPLNFTPPEALAIKYALEHFSHGVDRETLAQISGLSAALESSLGGKAGAALRSAGRGFVLPARTERMRAMIGKLMQASEDRRVVEIEYYSSHRRRLDKRRVGVFEIIEHGAHFYVYAWCELANATRHFRLERIRSARVLDERFDRTPPERRDAGRMAPLFGGKAKERMLVRLDEHAAPDVVDDWRGVEGVKIKELPGGRAKMDMPLFNPFWALGFVMSLGEHAELLKPTSLRKELQGLLKDAIAAHA